MRKIKMSVVRMKIKDAIKLSMEKERLKEHQMDLHVNRPLKRCKHVFSMPYSDEQYIVKLYGEGNTYDDISTITGYSKGAIGVHIRKYKKLWRCNFRKGRVPAINLSELVAA
jgi:hypothetical protein